MTASTELMDSVSRETLEGFAVMLEHWNKRINLVGEADTVALWDRHIMDCQRLVDLIPSEARTYLDIGSGAGLPGLVVAALRPKLKTTLIEADRRKCAFLRAARRDLNISADIICDRIEAADAIGADVISARALAPLSRLLSLAAPHGKAETRYLFQKGARWEEEVQAARERWAFDLQSVHPKDGGGGPILVISNVSERQ